MNNSNIPYIVGAISSKLGEATTAILDELKDPSKIPLRKLIEALEADPVAYACCLIKQARVMQLVSDEYTHEDKKIKDFINSNLQNIDESITEVVGRLSSAMPLGFSVAEVNIKNKAYKQYLDGFTILDPEKTVFRATNGKVKEIKYNDGGIDKYIPIRKCIHITNGLITNFGRKYLYGLPEMLRAYPYIRLKQLLYGQIGVAGKRLATGIVLAKVDSGKKVIITDNLLNTTKEVSKEKIMAQQLAKLESNSYIVTDKETEISNLSIDNGGQFWNLVSTLVDLQIMRAFAVPDTILQQGVASFGVGGLANVQLNILDGSIKPIATQIRDQLIDRAIKPVVILNFGIQRDYGKFKEVELVDPNQNNAEIQTLIQAISMGLLSNTDIDIMNHLRGKLNLPKVSPESHIMQKEIESQLQKLQMQSQMEMQTQMQNQQAQTQMSMQSQMQNQQNNNQQNGQ